MSRKTFGPVLTAAIMTLFLCLGAQAATIESDITDTADNEYNWTEATEITNGAVVTFTHTQKLSGPITITNGTLNLGKEGGFTSVTAITVGSSGTLNFASKSPFGTDGNPRTFTIEEGGVLDFTANNGTFANIAKIVLNGGTVQSSSTSVDANYGAFLFRDSVTANADSEITAPFTVRSGWGNNGGKPTWTVAENATLTISGGVRFQDTGATPDYPIITKAGAGTLLITSAAKAVHASSEFIISGGTLKFTNANSLQSSANAMKITVTNGKLQFEGKSGTPIRNNISIAANQNVEFKPTDGTVEYSGSLTGTGTFTNTSGEWQQLILSGNNSSFQGTIKNSTPNIPATETTPAVAGTNGLMFFNGVNSALPQGKFAGGGTVCFLPADADNSVFQFGELSGGGTLRPSTSTAANFTLQIGGLNTDSTFSGKLTDYDDTNNRNYTTSMTIEKVGTGTLTLTNSGNNYRGGTVVSAGTLETKALGRGAVSVEGGTFKYNGGTTTFASNLAVAEGGTFQLDKSGTTLTATGTLTGSGKIDVQNGTLSYTGSTTTLAQDINLGANGKFQYTHASTLSGDLTGSGVIQNSGGWSYYTGNNSAFEGTFQLNDLAFFQNGESSSGKATYKGGGPIILKVTDAAKNTYEFGKVTGSILIRPSNTSLSDHYVKIGGTNEDFTYSGVICDYVDKTTGLIKTGTGTLTLTADFSKAATITNDSNAKPYSLGTTVEDGRLVIAEGTVIGTGTGDRVVVNAVSETVHPAITLSGTIRGDLQIDGLLTIDFTDANNPVGIVTGDVLFGDSAGLQALSGNSGWNSGMTYTLKSANSDDTLAAMTRLLSEAIDAGTLSDIFYVMPTEGGVIIAVDGNKIPEPATWVLMILGLTGAVCVNSRRRRDR